MSSQSNIGLNSTPVEVVIVTESHASLTPLFVAILCIAGLGVIANTVVCFIFAYRLSRSSSTNVLVLYLAVFDNITCLFIIPTEVAEIHYVGEFINASSTACKLVHSFDFFCQISSVGILFLIAMDRHQKLCHPFSHHRNKQKRNMRIVFFISVILSAPISGLYGLSENRIEGVTVPLVHCYFSDTALKTSVPLIYYCILMVTFLGTMFYLASLYYDMLRAMKLHNRTTTNTLTRSHPLIKKLAVEDVNTNSSKNSRNSLGSDLKLSQKNKTMKNSDSLSSETPTVADKLPLSSNGLSSSSDSAPSVKFFEGRNETLSLPFTVGESANSVLNDDRSPKYTYKRHSSITAIINTRRNAQDKVCKILFLVTFLYIFSFLPHLCASLFVTHNPLHLEAPYVIMYYFCYKSYFMHAMTNPFIYGWLNPDFRNTVRRFSIRSGIRGRAVSISNWRTVNSIGASSYKNDSFKDNGSSFGSIG